MRTIDFAIIGAAKAGTTSLWEGARHHPQIALPPDKERPFFDSDDRYRKGLEWFVRWTYAATADDTRRGLATPGLMPADPRRLDELVSRIAETCPDIRLVAVLRDPVERAVSKFRQELRAGNAQPTERLDDYLHRKAPGGAPWAGTDVVSVGEYGRILGRYLEQVDRDRVLVLFTQDLDRRPQETFRRLFAFLGVDEDHVAPQPRVNVGGTGRRVSQEGLDELVAELDRAVFPAGEPETRRAFLWWLQHLWNIEPDDLRLDVPPALHRRLAEHYLSDADVLEALLGVPVPWRADLETVLAGVAVTPVPHEAERGDVAPGSAHDGAPAPVRRPPT